MPYLILTAYNLALLLPILVLMPVLVIIAALIPKYRLRILERLGLGLRKKLTGISNNTRSVVWVHALSVGETTSVLPLIKGLRKTYPDITIIFSSTTRSGQQLAVEKVAPYVHGIIPAPLDFPPTILWYISAVKPDIFILTETDFWPNWQFLLHLKGVKCILVNGRISKKSFSTYRSFAWLFKPFFSSFNSLSMQSQEDRDNMVSIGVSESKVDTLGNLKLDTFLLTKEEELQDLPEAKKLYGLSPERLTWICGSTHAGEEQQLLDVYRRLREALPNLQLILAPRNIDRSKEILALALEYGFTTNLLTDSPKSSPFDILIVNTIGELASMYRATDAAFIGGSLVSRGGHNPIEPAVYGIPVTFGKHMEDFTEPASALVQCGGALQAADKEELYRFMGRLLLDQQYRKQTGRAAKTWIRENQGVVQRHLNLLARFIPPPP